MERKIIREVTRQLTNPINGLPKNLDPPPKTLLEWGRCLESIDGWINLGITKKMSGVFIQLKIGEVVPECSSNLDFYTFGFATVEIHNFLQYRVRNEKKYILVLNYYSFCKLIKLMLSNKSKEYCISFHKSLKQIFQVCTESNFWLQVPITQEIKDFLQSLKIGEIILKNGKNQNATRYNMGNTKVAWESDIIDTEKDLNGISDICNMVDEIDLIDVKESVSREDVVSPSKSIQSQRATSSNNIDVDNLFTYKIIMNNQSLFEFLRYSCQMHKINKYENIFNKCGAYDDELENLFGSLSL